MKRNLDLSNGFTRTRRVSALVKRVGWLTARGKKQEASHELVTGMHELGGVFVKFLQIIANLLPEFPGLTQEIADTIYDSPHYQDVDIVSTLGKNLNASQLARISNINPAPFASGSFAQVYEATLDNSTQVVIKILRPHIRRQLKTDLKLLAILARVSQPLIRSDALNTTIVFKDYKKTVMQEIKYLREVEYALEMASSHKQSSKIVIPETFRELCTPEVIVQEKIQGLSLANLLTQAGGDGKKAVDIVRGQLGSNLISQLSELGYDLISSSIEGPYMYGDPHPGNIILMEKDKVGIIDFGVLLPKVVNPSDLYSVMESEGNMHFDQTETTNIAEHIIKVFRLYNPRTFNALERIDIEIKSFSIIKEFTDMIDKIIEPSKERIRSSYRKGVGIPAILIMESINGREHPNRFGLMAFEPTARITRAQSQFWNTIEQLGVVRETSMEVHCKLKEKFENTRESLKTDEFMSYTEATQILTDWFTELVERDPLLFGGLFAKIRKTLQEYEKEPSNA